MAILFSKPAKKHLAQMTLMNDAEFYFSTPKAVRRSSF
jgi:hypothetical protein